MNIMNKFQQFNNVSNYSRPLRLSSSVPILFKNNLNTDMVSFSSNKVQIDNRMQLDTLDRLYQDKYKPTRRVDENGMLVTTVIDK